MSNTILLTGARTGIGKATAKFFQEKGWNVVATMRSPEKEEELRKLDNPVVGAVMQAFQSRSGSLDQSTPESVADVIYGAATDGTSQLRYIAGADAEQLLGTRKSMDDEGFFGMMKAQMGL